MKRSHQNNINDGSPTDAELVCRAREGDKKAFVDIVTRYQAMVCGIALGILKEFAASEDASQDALIVAWKKFDELRNPDRLRPWLAQIARNTALGHLRQRKGNSPIEDSPALEDESPTPDQHTATREEAILVQDSLERLPETYRLALILYYRERQSIRSVAETLEISEDAVKQRLARGRALLRERMSGLVESVLTKTQPSAKLTMAIAIAIGALTAPAALAASVFTATSVATTGTSTTLPAILSAMTTSKPLLLTTALVVAVCVPIGYSVRPTTPPPLEQFSPVKLVEKPSTPSEPTRPSFEGSLLFAEWQDLHELHGTTPAAMPVLYQAIDELEDSVRRRSFRAALISEWVQVDPIGGMSFFLDKKRSSRERTQFFQEWLAIAPHSAVTHLLQQSDWERMGRDALMDIAKTVPDRLPEVASKLSKPSNYWDKKVTDAFATIAAENLDSARKAAEALEGPNRTQALAGVAQAWAKRDFDKSVAWAKESAEGTDQHEVIRAALVGLASVDPSSALDQIDIIPSGGRDGFSGVSTGSRVIKEAAKTNFEETLDWIAANPARLNYRDMGGLSSTVTDLLNLDPIAFMDDRVADGTLAVTLPALSSALLNDASGQLEPIWNWLKEQPESESISTLEKQITGMISYKQPEFAISLANDFPPGEEGAKKSKRLADRLWNGGQALHRFDDFTEQAPEHLREALINSAFDYVPNRTLHDPDQWIDRLNLVSDSQLPKASASLAKAWAKHSPEEAVDWIVTLPAGEQRTEATAAISGEWAKHDPTGAAEWIRLMEPGIERDRSAGSWVKTAAERYPAEAWEWALSIQDETERASASMHAAKQMAARDPATVQQWIETSPFDSNTRSQLRSALEADGLLPGK